MVVVNNPHSGGRRGHRPGRDWPNGLRFAAWMGSKSTGDPEDEASHEPQNADGYSQALASDRDARLALPGAGEGVQAVAAARDAYVAAGDQYVLHVNVPRDQPGASEAPGLVRQPYFVSWPGRSRCFGRVLRVCGTSGSGPGGGGSRCPIGPRVPVAMTVRSRRRAVV